MFRSVSAGAWRRLTVAVSVVVLVGVVWLAGGVADAGLGPPGNGIDVVYVAVSTNFPDSLGVGPGAGVASAPIIILPTDPPIPGVSATELVRLDPKRVVIVGGTTVISSEMAQALQALLPNATVERIAGANRYETNTLFSQSVFPVERWAAIPAAAFSAQNPDADAVLNAGHFAYNTTNGTLIAPIQLPEGAEILEFAGSGFDNNGSGALTFRLYREHWTNVDNIIAETATSDSVLDQLVSTTAIDSGSRVVDNETYAYFVKVTGATGSELFLHTARVRYRLGSP